MPKVAMDYSKTHFYKIVCKDLNIRDCYVGHTTNLIKRKHHHKNMCHNPNNRQYNCFKYQFIRENGGWQNWEIILIKTENCENSFEAVKKEREYIEQLQATLNKARPIISKEEEILYDHNYYIKNKEKHNQRSQDHYNEHKAEIKEYSRNYYYKNRDKILKQQKDKRQQDKLLQSQDN